MASSIPVLWSEDISVDVLSPLAILRAQQRPLSQMTKGLLEANIETNTNQDGQVRHQFDLVAHALNNSRYRILYASHEQNLVYPVIVEAECFLPDDDSPTFGVAGHLASSMFSRASKLPEGQRRAATDQEFIKLVGEVFRSPQVRSLIQSLIARSNDQKNVSEASPSDESESTE